MVFDRLNIHTTRSACCWTGKCHIRATSYNSTQW